MLDAQYGAVHGFRETSKNAPACGLYRLGRVSRCMVHNGGGSTDYYGYSGEV